jgi:ribosomal protein S18 acetylase RimI-like enzyme
MSITLRSAGSEDVLQVAEVILSSRRTFLPYAPLAHTDAEMRQWVRERLIPAGGTTVACDGESVIGVIAVAREADASWIEQLYVAPDHTDRGIGTRLLRHALASLELPARLYTFQANVRARSFYERHGFKATAFSDGSTNEEQCPDVLYELASSRAAVTAVTTHRSI